MAHGFQTYRYRVDPADCIEWVDETWLGFASENGASGLTQAAVLGRSLWDFVAGDATCRLYAEIHARVRTEGRRVVIPFRCDSPTLRRHLRLTISPTDQGGLMYESVLLRVEPQPYLRVLDSQWPRSDVVLTLCSCCKRALLESEGWLEVADVAVRLRLFDAPEVPDLRYSVCPRCAGDLTPALDNGGMA